MKLRLACDVRRRVVNVCFGGVLGLLDAGTGFEPVTFRL